MSGSDVHQFVPVKRIGNLILPKVSTDTLKLLNPNADALILGSSTEEGGDIKVYRDDSGNLQLSVDADAASNAKALDIYGGVVAQNYLTVGQTTLNTAYNLSVNGTIYSDNNIIIKYGVNSEYGKDVFYYNIPLTSGDIIDHVVALRVDNESILEVKATGDGAGGITNKAIGLYGTTPSTQAAAINDPAESTAANNAAIDSILAALRGIGLIAT